MKVKGWVLVDTQGKPILSRGGDYFTADNEKVLEVLTDMNCKTKPCTITIHDKAVKGC